MKYVIPLMLVLVPSLAMAQVEPTATQLLAREVAAAAIAEGERLACDAAFDRAEARVGEEITLVWASFGAAEPGTIQGTTFAPQGVHFMRLDTPGIWRFELVFLGAGGGEVVCEASVRVYRELSERSGL